MWLGPGDITKELLKVWIIYKMLYSAVKWNVLNSLCRVKNTIYRSVSTNKLENQQLQTSDVAADDDLPNLDENPFKRPVTKCVLCRLNIEPDYKNVRLLSQFQSRHTGRIYGRHITGLCKNQQQKVEKEILKAQSAGLMGIFTKAAEFVNDPKLFDPNRPFRPHKY